MKLLKNKLLIAGVSLLASTAFLQSCVDNEESPTTEINRYTTSDIQSYSDLFDIFWTTMDQRYNYFYEQKRKDGMDWDAVYKKYSPKFKALKSFGRSTENDALINEDYQKAKQYFEEIIDPIIDQHFNVKIAFPITNSNVNLTSTFYGGMKTGVSNNTYPFSLKYGYMKHKLNPQNSILYTNYALGGNLTTDPEIYYFSFTSFSLTQNLKISLNNKYLSPDEGNALILTESIIDKSSALNSIENINTRKAVRDYTVNILNTWNQFPKSTEVTKFNEKIANFNNTEILTNDFILAAYYAYIKSEQLISFSDIDNDYKPIKSAETLNYINWFISQMNNHVNFAYRLPVFQDAAFSVVNNSEFYQNFLNPLHKGNIKKIIIDLRSNGGGAVVDARFFSDRFITKNEIFAYQRSKEGNGRFNYTPWIPARTSPHQFGIPADIPIAILTDQGSASMSEITTMMLKSQGNQVVSIGDYSAGATAGLGGSDDFNGGTRDVIAGRLTFYMPLLAMKDANGEVIEGIGIKPDIMVTPPSDQELNEMKSSPKTYVDRVLNEAIKYLKTK